MESSVVPIYKDWMGMIEDQGTYSFLKYWLEVILEVQ